MESPNESGHLGPADLGSQMFFSVAYWSTVSAGMSSMPFGYAMQIHKVQENNSFSNRIPFIFIEGVEGKAE